MKTGSIGPTAVRCAFAAMLAVGAASWMATSSAAGQNGRPAESARAATRTPGLGDTVNERMGLRNSRLVSVDLATPPGNAVQARLEVAGQRLTLDLVRHSVRSEGYRVYHSGRDGELTPVPAGPVNTLRGTALEAPGSVVTASLMKDGFHATIDFADGDRYWIEPIARHVDDPAAAGGLHVVYHDLDVLAPEGGCATNDRMVAHEQETFGGDEDALAGGGLAAADVAELACDADYEYFLTWGEETENRINAIINQINIQYERDVEITHVINAIVVRTAPVYTKTAAFELLTEFRSRWLVHHSDIVRDLAHLFSGKELDGATIGIAWDTGVVCTTQAYCLSESDFNAAFACVTDVTAHELGHLWNASHCNCTSFTMNPFIVCANIFSSGSISSIINHRDSRTCLNSPPIDPYCSASAGSVFESISRVTFGDIDHSSGSSGYSNFTALSTSVLPGDEETITVTLNAPFGGDIGGLWIDWNGDKDFNDANETIPTSWSGVGPYVATVSVPLDATPGPTRMRVRMQDGASDPTLVPCGAADYGEVEDYTVIIIDDTPPPPVNDDCANAILVGDQPLAFTNVSATTDGPVEEFVCEFNGYAHLESDVWFRYDAPCTGLVTIGLCNSGFNTKMAVYEECPIELVPVVACNDDACGSQSIVVFPAMEGSSFLIRVGGFEGAQGEGEIDASISCMFPPCPADLDGNETVDFNDLLELLFGWGPCGACPEDLDDDGEVDFEDLLILLFAWGPC